MRQIFCVFLVLFPLLGGTLAAQLQMRGLEIGPWAGVSYYLGDLNTEFRFNRPNVAGGFAARYNFNHRIAVRGSFNYGQVEARDSDSQNTFERRRNLSFQSNVFDLTGQFEFNFLPYFHGSPEYFFTPYAFVGGSVFRYNPMAREDAGILVNLRRLGTEGQLIGEEYSLLSVALAYGVGIRWDLTYELSMEASLSMRNTRTDYLDDVSTVYPNVEQLKQYRTDLAGRMSDRSRSFVDGEVIDRTGTQRGDSSFNDHYIFLGIGINYYFGDVLCPKVYKGRKKARR